MCTTPSELCHVRLDSLKDDFCKNALADRTRAAYKSGVNTFIFFCYVYNIDFDKAQWVGDEKVMVDFVCYCVHVKQLAHSTIKLYLAGLRHHCITEGLEYPFCKKNFQPMLQLKLVLTGIKKSRTPSPVQRLPITAAIMDKLCSILNGKMFNPYVDKLVKAAISLAYFGFLRCGEFTSSSNVFDPETNVCLGDVTVHYNEAFLMLKASKTDPFHHGVVVSYFRVECQFCPVEALENFLKARTRFANNPNAPLFLFENYTHLTRATFLDLLHRSCERVGLDSSYYKGHSFRIGAATSAAANGIQDHLIQCLGRWSSDAYKIYVRVEKASIRNAQQKMAII